MHHNSFFHFLSLLLFRQQRKHIGAVLISVAMIFLLSATLFISTSLERTLLQSLDAQPDLTVTRVQAGRAVDTPLSWADRIMEIEGIEALSPRVYGRYFFTPKGKSFLIIGVDLFDEQSHRALQKLIDGLNLEKFLSSPQMIVGEGVSRFMKEHFFHERFTFKTPKGVFKEVGIYATIPASLNLMANDVILMPIDLAREIFGMDETMVTDITFNVPNDAEWDNIISKLQWMFYDIRIVDKREVKRGYESLYNYKGGLFLSLYLVAIVTFMLILYQRYTMVYATERKEIGILRAVGWSIKDVLILKFYENMSVVLVSFILGTVGAYIFVFVGDAPLLRNIFLGSADLPNDVSFVPTLPFGLLVSLFLLYAVPFFAAVLVPAWRVAVTPAKEAML